MEPRLHCRGNLVAPRCRRGVIEVVLVHAT
jgi:hypothetical protein